MNDDKFCTVCKIKIDRKNYKKDRTFCKNCYSRKEKKKQF